MKKVTFIFTLIFAFMLSSSAMAKDTIHRSSEGSTITSNMVSMTNSNMMNVNMRYLTELNYSEGCFIDSEDSCTITATISVNWVIGGSIEVSQTSDTCMEAWNKLKEFAKQIGGSLFADN